MPPSGNEPLDHLQQLLAELDAFAPMRETPEAVVYRTVDEAEIIEDSLPPPESPLSEQEQEQSFDLFDEDFLTPLAPPMPKAPAEAEGLSSVTANQFRTAAAVPIVAVDCGIARLGETENGLIIALRSALVIDAPTGHRVSLFRSGPLYLHNGHKAEVLLHIGTQLGKRDFFVEVEEASGGYRATRVKSGVADDSHQYGDRLRNWFERVVQRIAINAIEGGVVLFDGALTLRTRDTPRAYLEELANRANARTNALVAVSKQSLLQVGGRSVRFWLNDVPNKPCYRLLTPQMRRDRARRVLGNAYAVRFSALGPTLRMDVKSSAGYADHESIGRFYASTLMRGGYPDILVRAHAYSYFTSPDVIQLQAEATARFRLTPQSEPDLTGIFGPFGGRFK